MEKLKIAIVGVALGHPFTFTNLLQQKGIQTIYVWERVKERLEPFCEQFPNAIVCHSYEELLQQDLDGAIICTESSLHDQYSTPFMERGVPIFIDKVMAIQEESLKKIENTYKKHNTPVMSTSILRFSPLIHHLRKIDISGVLAVNSIIFHSIEHYFNKGNTWQDEIDKGGGTLQNMGIHGVELIYSVLGKGVKRVCAYTNTRYLKKTQSEDMAVILLDYGNGLLSTVNLVCGTTHHGYEIDVFNHDSRERVVIPRSDSQYPLVDYGYDGTIDRFIQMVRTGEEPIDFLETLEIMKVLIASRKSSNTGRWIEVEN